MKPITMLTKTWIILLCFMPAHQAAAAETATNQIIPMMEEIIVTATKIPEKRKDIPNAIVTMNASDIAASGSASLDDLLANEPGLDGRSYGDYMGGAKELHIRGFRGNGTKVLVNGVPVNSPSLGLTDLGKIPLDNVDRLEIIKGSGSMLYGSGAMGGVLNITTPSPQKEKMDLHIRAGYGSHNTYRLGAAQGMYFTDDWGYYLTVNRTETTGDRPNSFLRKNDASFKLTMNGDNELLKINLYGNYLNRDYGLPGVRPPAGTADYHLGGQTLYNSESANLLAHGGDSDALLSLEVTGTPLSWLEYTLQGYYLHMEMGTHNRFYTYLMAPAYTVPSSGTETDVANKTSGITGHVNLAPFTGASLLIGGEYRHIRWKNENTPLDNNGSRLESLITTDKAYVNSGGFFSEFQYRPSPYGKILAGIRHEKHSEFGSINLPFFGFILNLFTNTALKFNHGRHFLAPTFNDLFWPDADGMKGNPDLKPEKGWHTDITLEQSLFRDRLFFSLSYFRWHVNDKIQWEPDSQGVYTSHNLLDYKGQGFEGGIKAAISPNIRLGLSYTYLDAEEKNRAYTMQDYGWPPFIPPNFQYNIVKRRAAYTPRQQFKGNLIYRTERGFTASATVRYTSNRLLYNTEITIYPNTRTVTYTLAPYWTGDLKIEQQFLKHYTLSLSINNMANKQYDTRLERFFTDPVTLNSQLCGYPGSGRLIFLDLSYKF
ncbi:MAG: TonB-dependent receptor [Syntrophobacterales bacterium]|jgi:iron complex outermembrane receptor protein|nr:TonB-dependent receptor [Syntrophobacterales bacterium]